jgi:predicted acetylornithine/succinylornithine family transaminase
MKLEELKSEEARVLVPTYARAEVGFARGEGVYLYDYAGERYLDFAGGIAVTALGHAHPAVVRAVTEQISQLTHVSNLYYTLPQVELARSLVDSSFADQVFYTNSGSEANETALKFARKWGRRVGGERKTQVVAFHGAFHGRTYGALSLTHKQKYRDPFRPLLPGITFVPFNDLRAAARAINERTCAVFVEPVQGEGGVHPASPAFMQALRAGCDEHQALLVCDEVQCGMGRTGHLWAHQHYGIVPDLMTLAKPLAGGLPIGVTLVREQVSEVVEIGDHGSTFGGGPVVCRAGMATLREIQKPGFLDRVTANGAALQSALRSLKSPGIREIRGAGLLVGVEFEEPVKPLMQAALERGMIVINAGERVLRLCPPLIIEKAEIQEGVAILGECLEILGIRS